MRRTEEDNPAEHHDSQNNNTAQSGHLGTDDRLSPPLNITKNKSTGNLSQMSTSSLDKNKKRISMDIGGSGSEYDGRKRASFLADHDHGLGMSGLRRIRQQQPSAAPSAANSRSPSVSLSRSTSLTMLLANNGLPIASGPTSPTFAEDLSRFPSESLHSFSFAHQSEELIHNRQNVLKRSMDFLQDRMGRTGMSNAGIASAHARATGDADMQNMLGLLSKAKLVGASNLPHGDSSLLNGPLTGPAEMDTNVFDQDFGPRSASPTSMEPLGESPTTTRHSHGFSSFTKSPVGSASPPRSALLAAVSEIEVSNNTSRTSTNESGTTQQTSPTDSRRPSMLKRTLTDVVPASIQQKLMDALAKPFRPDDVQHSDPVGSPHLSNGFSETSGSSSHHAVHGHSNRWVPAAQAIFTTEAKAPWTIIAANDLACLLFGVTTAEVRKMGILEVVQEERRAWLKKKLEQNDLGLDSGAESETETTEEERAGSVKPRVSTSLLGSRGGGITARLLSKPSSRYAKPPMATPAKRPETFHSGDWRPPKVSGGGHSNHRSSRSRGVLLCGDVVPIQKRNGATGSASLWVKEKRVGLIWVLEEIREDSAILTMDEDGNLTGLNGELSAIWGDDSPKAGQDISKLVPKIPRQGIDPRTGPIDYNQVTRRRYYTCRNCHNINIPATVEQVRGKTELRVSSFPHIAGIIVVDPETLQVKSSNSVFCGALFGHEKADGMSINALVPDFDKVLRILTETDGIHFVDGIVIPEHSFRRAAALIALREGRPNAANSFLKPEGLPAKHRDGSELKIDVQMRVVQSEKKQTLREETLMETSEEEDSAVNDEEIHIVPHSETVYALWITYSRSLHATRSDLDHKLPTLASGTSSLHQPSPGQTPAHTPVDVTSDADEPKQTVSAKITKQIKDAAAHAAAVVKGTSKNNDEGSKHTRETSQASGSGSSSSSRPLRKEIGDFTILEEMGQGAYGQVKLARYRPDGKKCVLKYVTKRRILVDTWTRDRRLGTVPLEIHVLDYLRRDGYGHPNIVEMEDFFEDDINYYIEMVPHGLPGMDLFDYIELRTNMEERECRSIFVQVASAVQHLHTKALVVHRDIKDENVIMNGEGNIKLIDFGSAAYIRNGPFDVFVGTIDYAAPEVLAGRSYSGKEQDVWALGILLYTIVYKENPFYSIDEIMDRDLRVPYTVSDESIDLIRGMLDRDVNKRLDIGQVMEHPWCKAGEGDS